MANSVKKRVIALGFFDCVHYAHRKILDKARETASKIGAVSAAITFKNNIKPLAVVYSYDERVAMLNNVVDEVVSFDFTSEFKNTSAEDFLTYLKEEYCAVGFVCGFDYRFGRNATGDVNLIRSFCAKYDMTCEIIDKCFIDNVLVSSTTIKELLCSGQIEKANKLLVEPYHITNKVRHGRGQGHIFGFPTVNFDYNSQLIAPKMGVYSTMSDIDGVRYKSVTNVGAKPTFDDKTLSIETFIQDFSRDVYGKDITIIFDKWLRDIKKFESPEQLKQQIYEDIRR